MSTAGTLFLIVGPSGSGKDTLILEAQRHFEDDPRLMFCKRVITREDQNSEKHAAVSDDEFERIAASGGFFLSWDAHNLRYGIPADALRALEAGKTVVANVSRRIIGEAIAMWPDTHIIHVTANRDVLRARLIARGRETAAAMESRLERSDGHELTDARHMTEIDNSGELRDAAQRFIAIIKTSLNESAESVQPS